MKLPIIGLLLLAAQILVKRLIREMPNWLSIAILVLSALCMIGGMLTLRR